ncbi:CHAD domain-containing protein [Lacibacter luteus]|nr:CHAD domain-containing protein [Lacibacter luteus]
MNILQQYTVKQLDTATKLLKEYAVEKDPETLHQLRVALKKIKAVLHYLRSETSWNSKKSKQLLQLLFRAAGTVREMHLRSNWLQQNNYSALAAAAQLQQKIKEEESVFVDRAAEWEGILVKLQTKLEKLTSDTKHEQLLKYIPALKEQVGQFSFATSNEGWHEYRKQVKQLLYAQHWLTEKEKLQLLPVNESKRLDTLQEKIGNWHDMIDMFDWLQEQQFYLSKDKLLHSEYNRAIKKLQQQQLKAEQQLQTEFAEKKTALTQRKSREKK